MSDIIEQRRNIGQVGDLGDMCIFVRPGNYTAKPAIRLGRDHRRVCWLAQREVKQEVYADVYRPSHISVSIRTEEGWVTK